MTGQRRHCARCGRPLRATARADARFCGRACKAAARRQRLHNAETIEIALSVLEGKPTTHVVRCPVCGRRFALGHGHRRDAVYDRPACRQAAYRARLGAVRQGVREAVTEPASVTALGTRCAPVTCTDDASAEATVIKTVVTATPAPVATTPVCATA